LIIIIAIKGRKVKTYLHGFLIISCNYQCGMAAMEEGVTHLATGQGSRHIASEQ
jgi:hypothetical protein